MPVYSCFCCEHIGSQTYHKLIDHFGSAEHSLQASYGTLQKIGLNKLQIDALQNSRQEHIKPTLDWLEGTENHILFSDESSYPETLKQLFDPPPLLFAKGDWTLLHEPQIAMVGSRNATSTGREIASEFAAHLSRLGLIITSGLASGIDAAAHLGALSKGQTIAVVGTGLDRVYPASNKNLAEEIVAKGLIVSEFGLGVKPLPGHFPRRNRIISALSLGTLVVEATAKSGSLITAKHATEQGKEVFAIPGSIYNPLSKGCHQLIRQGAKLVETADDILFELREPLRHFVNQEDVSVSTATNQTENSDFATDKEQQQVLEAIDYNLTTIEQIIQRSRYSSEKISSMLLILELNGLISSEQGRYRRR